MPFKGKLAAVDGRKLCFGERSKDGRYEHEFTLAQGGKVFRGIWPDLDPVFLSDLKNGMEVRVSGVPYDAMGGASSEASAVVILLPNAGNRSRSTYLAERAAKIAKRSKS